MINYRINGIEYTADQIDAAVKVMKGAGTVTLTFKELFDGTQDISDVVINRRK